jgi:hypothetical protein
MTEGSEVERGRGLGLWRLLPFFGLLLLPVGNLRHAFAMPGDTDGARTLFFGLFIAGFVAVYGQPSLFGGGVTAPRAARQRTSRFAAIAVAAIALVGAAAFSQAGWLGLWTPRSRTDWLVVALNLGAAWLYLLHFHAVWSERHAED